LLGFVEALLIDVTVALAEGALTKVMVVGVRMKLEAAQLPDTLHKTR
jgi:hypothetical protein